MIFQRRVWKGIPTREVNNERSLTPIFFPFSCFFLFPNFDFQITSIFKISKFSMMIPMVNRDDEISFVHF
ncbi:hypothetical protein RJT34_13409 [Clitoria ternatea]|uniref:Uncharacterized protein n=1 Tax=Clitoria ternatea TaxID=43366 RepID=A0AAN9JR27_CLITE